MNNEPIDEQLLAILVKKSGLDKSSIQREFTIEEDLGITGEDAEELIREISYKFKVDISNFQFSKYFYDEPSIFTNQREVIFLTVADIEKAIFSGKLE